MQGSRPTTDADGPLRGRLRRLDGLPLRPATVVAPAGPTPNQHLPIDPGRALIRSLPGPGARPDPSIWPVVGGRADEARERLWRFCVASALAAHRLASAGGDPDPGSVARVALLHPVALWALAAAGPDRLADWLEADRDDDRLRLEASWFGADAAGFGLRLARRWGAGPGLADAAQLADYPSDVPPDLAHDPILLGWVRLGRSWAMSTPWALPGPSPELPPPTDDQRRWLVATVQARCSGGLAPGPEAADPERLLRRAMRADLRADRLEEELADLSDRLRVALDLLAQPRPEAEPEAEPQAPRLADPSVLDAMAEFAAGAAHELNNPLAIIAGRAQILQSRSADPDQRKALQTIIGQARRAHQILRDLIYIARPPRPREVPCLPEQVLQGVVTDLAAEALARKVRLVCRKSGPGSTVVADPEALRHLADALIRNALEATPEGGEVVAESNPTPRSIVWTIRDDGIGLDQERAGRLLDPFYCGRQAGRGLGLGLPRVARFLESVGGSISWDDAESGGTIVRVELPHGPEARPSTILPGLRDAC